MAVMLLKHVVTDVLALHHQATRPLRVHQRTPRSPDRPVCSDRMKRHCSVRVSGFQRANVYWIGGRDRPPPSGKSALVLRRCRQIANIVKLDGRRRLRMDVPEVDHEALFDPGMRAFVLYADYSYFATDSRDIRRLVCA